MGNVPKAIAAHHQEFIKFPAPHEILTDKYKFAQADYCQAWMNKGLHPRIANYTEIKTNIFSANIQAVCSPDLEFTNPRTHRY